MGFWSGATDMPYCVADHVERLVTNAVHVFVDEAIRQVCQGLDALYFFICCMVHVCARAFPRCSRSGT